MPPFVRRFKGWRIKISPRRIIEIERLWCDNAWEDLKKPKHLRLKLYRHRWYLSRQLKLKFPDEER